MDASTFLRYFPEFGETNPVIVQAKLLQASVRMGGPDPTIWGSYATAGGSLTKADLAQGHLAAHYLVTSPFGTDTRLAEGKGKRTTYLETFEDLVQAFVPGFLVSG